MGSSTTRQQLCCCCVFCLLACLLAAAAAAIGCLPLSPHGGPVLCCPPIGGPVSASFVHCGWDQATAKQEAFWPSVVAGATAAETNWNVSLTLPTLAAANVLQHLALLLYAAGLD